jgi:outer membrane protein assembly factor BamB
MKKELLSKTLVMGVIFLFIGAGVFPVTGTLNNENLIKNHTQIKSKSEKSATSNSDEWPQFKHDSQGTGYINSTGPENDNVLWKYTLGYMEAYQSPAIVDSKVYMTSQNYIFYCFDAFTGDIIWSDELYLWSGTGISSPVVYDGKVYQGLTYNYTYCWDANTGELIWRFQMEINDTGYGTMSCPTITDGKFYISKLHNNQRAHLFCLDAYNGSLIWDYYFGVEGTSSPVVYEGKVYIGTGDNEDMIYCFNGNNGNIIWSKNFSADVISSAAVVNNKVYIGSGSKLWCLNATNGVKIWNYSIGEPCGSRSPSIANGKVYFSHIGNRCFDADTGELIWYTPGSEGALYSAVCNGKFFTGSNDSITCLDSSDGSIIWEKQIGISGYKIAPPAVAFGNLYVSSGMFPYPDLYCFGEVDSHSNPPITPTIDGPTSGFSGNWYNFSLYSVDPDGDEICYKINWGDGHTSVYGPFPSGEYTTIRYKWSYQGFYNVKVQARDINLKTSDWIDPPYNVNMTAAAPVLPINPVPGNNVVDVDVNNNLYWECEYPASDPIFYDVYLEEDDLDPDVLVSENQTKKVFNPGHLNHSTQYYWQIVVRNILGETISGPVWSFTTEENVIPSPPYDPRPPNGHEDVDINVNIRWSCVDPDDDPLTFDVFFGDSYPPSLVMNNHTENTFDPGTMDNHTKYYWRIVAWDYLGLMNKGIDWEFTTGDEPNNKPFEPSDPVPVDGAIDVDIIVNLSWVGGDPDEGDTVLYDVFFEADNPDPEEMIANDISETSFDPGPLEYNTTYYWWVKAVDNHYAVVWGSVWCFTTELEPNNPPDAPVIDGPLSGTPGKLYDYVFNSVDPDGDNVRYYIDWGDDTYDITGFDQSGKDVIVSHSWDGSGKYTITAFAEDSTGRMGSSSTIIVTMQRDKATSNVLFWKLIGQFPLLNLLLQRFRISE